MKKFMGLLIAGVLMAGVLVGCASNEEPAPATPETPPAQPATP